MKIATLFTASALTICLLQLPLTGFASDKAPPEVTPQEEVKDSKPETETPSEEKSASNNHVTSQPDTPVYQPPLRGAPIGRVAGGTRGVQDKMPFLCVLAPDHIGLTHVPQPELYWFISESTKYPVELTIIEIQGISPVLETRLPLPTQPGVQRIALSDHDIGLQPGVQYKWFVSLVPDSKRRSRDIIAGGGIEYADLPEAINARLRQVDKMQAAHVYAQSGFWYDALAELSQRIEASPQNKVLWQQRASLARQVGLEAVADFKGP
jgi:hypothetical protein